VSILRAPFFTAFKPGTALLMASLVLASLVLAACSSAEERAEERYQSALELLEEGDVGRAIVQLRSVFELNGSHREARLTLARLLLNERNNPRAAYSQYLRLAEQYPDDLETRIALTRIAFDGSNGDEIERHGRKAAQLAPDHPEVQALNIARAYRAAVRSGQDAARRDQARAAQQQLVSLPGDPLLRKLIIDNEIRQGNPRAALTVLEGLVKDRPKDPILWRQRLSLLVELEDIEGVEAQLYDMVTRFPEDATHKQTLIRFLLARQAHDKAEAFMRELLAEAQPGDIGPQVDLVQFLHQVRGAEAAVAELSAAIERTPDVIPYRMMLASLDFDAGNQQEAVLALETVLSEVGEESSEDTRKVRITLARMFLRMGNEVGARAQVEKVLLEEPTNVQALKLRASWQIEADETDLAIASLRTALEGAPEDTQAMGLMAQAYIRSGQPRLARDFLALAVEASNNAPRETVQYARVLIQDKSYLAAEDVLKPALKLQPNNLDVLVQLGQVYLLLEDWTRTQDIIDAVNRIDTDAARASSMALSAELLNRRSGPETAMEFLSDLGNGADASLNAQLALLRGRLSTGDRQGALAQARKMAANAPDDLRLAGMLASVERANGNLEIAETIYRQLLEDDPRRPGVWLELIEMRLSQGDRAGAITVLDDALEVLPQIAALQVRRANFREEDGDIDGAIAIYEELYARNSRDAIVANNLASLISTYRTDEESLKRAWAVARRFSDEQVPAFQDTYGWITHRLGKTDEALPYLEAAAAGLPNDALVQYHLGEAYGALGRQIEALSQYKRAVNIAGEADTRPQIEAARAQIQALEASPAEEN
jgi:tetratricopeptide (TPR) repeat protein